ncbi:hypothetical protein Ccrd_017374 [Cynara cardunculus var. scolymus]|uniref:Uncharacterized protein n=1 Tax=Cynara cardunculus var. scolymus TaxID=59895 RepID=A0A103Y885_CYNCS|nr:hypothetical protein Ccrd_017374 [Cynara cardunculus var. scolymus]
MKRSYAYITPPKFDLGISPIKQPKPVSIVWREELQGPELNRNSKGIERSSPMESELLFSTPNDMKLHPHAIESLGCTTTIYISVIDAWATLLNYGERLMIWHLNTVGYATGKELDETGQERLRMD